MNKMQRYYYYKENDLCVDCGFPIDNETMRCSDCREKQRIRQKERRKKLRESGMCQQCGKNVVNPGYTLCHKCMSDWKNYYDENEKKERQRKTDVRIRRKEQGLCPSCGKKRDSHRIKCNECHKKSIEHGNAQRKRRIEQGLCAECGKSKPQKDLVVCPICHEKQYTRQVQNKERNYAGARLWRKELRKKILDAYGNKCACCGETEEMFLEIDHINNDGSADRKIRRGTTFHKWLIDNNFPADYQLLCRNCNYAKFRNGGICPHQLLQNNP